MDIDLLLNRSGLVADEKEHDILKKSLEDIIELLKDIPEPTHHIEEKHFVKLHEDIEGKEAKKDEILEIFHNVEKDMVKL